MSPTTDAQASPTFKSRLRSTFNFPYLVTCLFVIKVGTIIVLTGGAIAVSIWYASWGESRYYNFVAVTGIVVALISIVLNFTDLTGKLPKIPWNVIEISFDLLWAILILVASAIVTDKARNYKDMNSYAAGAFFGYTGCLLYFIDALIRIIKLKRGVAGFTVRSNVQATYGAQNTPAQPTYTY